MNEFNQLWDEVTIMVDFEAKRIKNSSGKVNVQHIGTYYKTEIIEKLWFNSSFPNKYNKWISDYYDEQPAVRQAIRESMDSFSPVPQKKQSPALLVVGIMIFVLGMISFAIPDFDSVISACLTVVGLGLGVWALVRKSNAGKYCDTATLARELDRIKNQINTLTHEHANS